MIDDDVVGRSRGGGAGAASALRHVRLGGCHQHLVLGHQKRLVHLRGTGFASIAVEIPVRAGVEGELKSPSLPSPSAYAPVQTLLGLNRRSGGEAQVAVLHGISKVGAEDV